MAAAGPVAPGAGDIGRAFPRHRVGLDLRALLSSDPEIAHYQIIGRCAAPSARRTEVLARLRNEGL
ncbi:hypothetical protein [Thermomonospora curvata]|uniref:Uncharacterized protein n=1 Tax=Thermomonospora curvata (strain ATCC 19995 / DSM 43183 / JCM 3096 / KCTC 9072 / NBRC 15933 / NCIMB 10081 / Henssen B9) TaxID=471852 RepID=D1A2U7_THECD|nr:hypothetical protein [Thermomonospora curvata]ACY97895.1 hypothetical protein Tcur_2329 [Thermomonospora curvata DSM 43183]